MTLSISQQDQVNSSGGAATPPADAILLVAMMVHEGSSSGTSDWVQWNGAAETQRQYAQHAGRNGGSYERVEIWLIPEPDVSGAGTFSWEQSGKFDARLYWITSDNSDCNPYALVTDVDEGGGSTTSIVGVSGDDVVLFIFSQNTTSTMQGCTVDNSQLTTEHWGHEEPWVNGIANTTSGSGSPVYAGIALNEFAEPRAEVSGVIPAMITASGQSRTKPELATFAVIMFAHGPNNAVYPTNVVLGGESCTLVAQDGGGAYEKSAIWYLDDPPEGSLTLTWTGNHQAQIIWLINIDHDSPLVASDVNSPADFSGSGSAGDFTCYAVCHQNNPAVEFTEKQTYTPRNIGDGTWRSFGFGTKSASGSIAHNGGNNSFVGALFAYSEEAAEVSFLPRASFFFSMAGLAIPAAMGKIIVPSAGLIDKLT